VRREEVVLCQPRLQSRETMVAVPRAVTANSSALVLNVVIVSCLLALQAIGPLNSVII
jgi:hypothetical protein